MNRHHPLREFVSTEEGATAIEYGLIVALVFLAIVGALTAYAAGTGNMYQLLTAALGAAL